MRGAHSPPLRGGECMHPLKDVFQRELDQTRVHRTARNLSEVRVRQIVRWIAELRMIEHIEEFSSELQIRVLVDASDSRHQIGRASCRERVEISVVAG